MNSRPCALTLGIAIVLTSGVAQASMIYPDLIKQQLGLTYSPACTLCHNTLNGGFGTVTTPFGRTMTGLGLTAVSPTSLQRALDQAKAQRVDSDNDGDADIDEIIAGRDPNDRGSAQRDAGGSVTNPTSADPIPEYGCTMSRVADGPGELTVVAGCLVALLRRRSRVVRD